MFYRSFSDITLIFLHKMDFKTALIPFSEVPLTKQVLLELLKEYKRPFDKINELGKQGILVMIKNGLYVPGPASLVRGSDPFLLADHNNFSRVIHDYSDVKTGFTSWKGMLESKLE
jgi:hypothetical protein